MANVPSSELLPPPEPAVHRSSRRQHNVAMLVGAGAIVLMLVLSGVYLLTLRGNGGPIDGNASSPDEFVASFPEDWGCKTTTKIQASPRNGDSVAVHCKDPSGLFLWVEDGARSQGDSEADPVDDFCVVVSGRTLWTGQFFGNVSGRVVLSESKLSAVESAFQGTTERQGDGCP